MTKMKSKKMTKSTFAIIIMGIVMVAMLAFGGTFAYFTAKASDKTASVTMGHVRLAASGDAFETAATGVMPGDKVAVGGVTLTATTNDDEGEWVAIKVTIVGDKASALAIDTTSLGADWERTAEKSGIFVYNKKLTSTVTVFAEGFQIATSVNDVWEEGKEASNSGIMNATVTVKVESRGIQASNVTLETAKTELATLFGA